MRTIAALLISLLVCGISLADNPETQLTADQWYSTVLAGTGSGLARVGWRPDGGNVAVFGQGVWLRDIGEDQTEGLGGHVGATYDVIHEDPVQVGKWTIPVTWYVGAIAGAVKPEAGEWETSPGILTGLSFGSDTIRVVIEGWYLPGPSISAAWPDIEESGRLLVGAELRL